jgi:dTDP-4-dehydrorhamnose 3,5-epimerase
LRQTLDSPEMKKLHTKIHDAWLLKPKVFGDARGFFMETWNRDTFRDAGLDIDFVQDNHSRSAKHVLRGLHYQAGETAQGKLVWVTSGTVFDVLVDLRQSSPTFGVWDGYVLNTETHDRLWVPPGCAHGFLVLSDVADFHYKVSRPYRPDMDRSLRWNDPDLAIDWPIEIGLEPIVSPKDAAAATFAECEKYA